MFAFPISSTPAFLAQPSPSPSHLAVDDDDVPMSYATFDARRTALEQLALAKQQEQRRQAEAAAFLAEQRHRQRQAAIEQALREEAERRRLEEALAYRAALIRQAQQEEEERRWLVARRRAAISREQRRREEDQQRRRIIEARRQRQQQVDLPSFFQFVLDFAPENETIDVKEPFEKPAAQPAAQPTPIASTSTSFASAPAPSVEPTSSSAAHPDDLTVSSPPVAVESFTTSPDLDEAASVLQRHFRRHLARRTALSALSTLSSSFESRQSAFTLPTSLTFQSSPSPSSTRSPTPPLAFGAPNASFLAYEDFLVNLLSKIDAVESGGDRAVKSARKELVRKVEKELARLDAMKDRAWEEQSESAEPEQDQQEEDAEMSPAPRDDQGPTPIEVHTTVISHSPSPCPAVEESCTLAPEPVPSSPSPVVDSTPSPSAGDFTPGSASDDLFPSPTPLTTDVAVNGVPAPAPEPAPRSPSRVVDSPPSPSADNFTPGSTSDDLFPSPTPLTAHVVSSLPLATPRVSRPVSPSPSDSSASTSTLSVSSGSSSVDAYISEMLRRAQKLGEEVATMEEAEHVRLEKVADEEASSEAGTEPFELL
ncbi:hypothetical protein JCM21900_000855 [Sporobolomyces salmonicolor]